MHNYVHILSIEEQHTISKPIHTIETVPKWKGKPRLTAYLNYEKLCYADPLRIPLDSNMTTSHLESFSEKERRHIISLITRSADEDKEFR